MTDVAATALIVEDPNNAPLWQFVPDATNPALIALQAMVAGAWSTILSVDSSTGRMILPALAVNNHPGVPFQFGLTVGLGKKDGSDIGGGVNYLHMFSNDPYEEYFQFNQGMVPNADPSQVFGFQECIVQHSSYVPLVTNYQHRVRTIDDAGASTSARDAYIVDGGSLANGWERFFKFWGNGGAVVVGAISAYLYGIERRLRLWAGGALVAECHEDGGMTIGRVPSMGAGTLNVARGLFVNGVQK